MGKSNIGLSVLFLIILLSDVSLEPAAAGPSLCGNSCAARCARAGVADRCLKYCGICCEKCRCVPSGTYGNKHECPCYRDWRNSKGTSKCP